MVRRVRECCNPILVGQKTHPRLPALEPSPSTLSDPTAVPEADERNTVCARLA